MLAGLPPSGKKSQSARSSSRLIFSLAVASFMLYISNGGISSIHYAMGCGWYRSTCILSSPLRACARS